MQHFLHFSNVLFSTFLSLDTSLNAEARPTNIVRRVDRSKKKSSGLCYWKSNSETGFLAWKILKVHVCNRF